MNKNKIIALILVMCITLSCILSDKNVNATRLFTSDKSMVIGSTNSISLFAYYGKKKPKWSTKGGKLRIISRSKTSCKVKAINVGTGTLNCKIGKRAYKLKIKVREKDKATFANYQVISTGMYINEVEDIIGKYTDVYSSQSQTKEQYYTYERYNYEYGGGWEDSLWMEQTTYRWRNMDDGHCIYVTFKDGISCDKWYL